jgi:predicted aspartyl protease
MRALTAFVAFVACAALPASAQSVALANNLSAPGLDDSTRPTDLQARNDGHDRLTVGVTISGTGPYRFLVDTGANRTALSRELAVKLGLARSETATLYSVTDVQEVGTARIPVLDWTAEQIRNVDAALLDPSHMGADGILGLDALGSQRILFNFENNTLTMVPSNQRIREDPDAILIIGRARNGRLIFTDAWIGGISVTLVIDTGAEVSVGNDALRKKLIGRHQAGGETIELQSVTGGKLVGNFLTVPELKVEGVKLRGLPIMFAPSELFKQLRLDQKPAILLGMNALRGFKKVSIDVSRRRLKVVLPEQSAIGGMSFASR